jgi:DNA gyrase subunit B
MTQAQTYTADSIKALQGLEAIQRKPGMYIGGNGLSGLAHLAFEILDNSVDEAGGGYGETITVTLHKDGSISVNDEGRGIPVGWSSDMPMSALQIVATHMHGGGKFDADSPYSASGGTHGIGLKAANALSHWLQIDVRRDGVRFRQRFENGGVPTSLVQILDEKGKVVGHITEKTQWVRDKKGMLTKILDDKGKGVPVTPDPNLGTGTMVRFRPNRQWFVIEEWDENDESVPWDWGVITHRMSQVAYLMPNGATAKKQGNYGVRFHAYNEITGKSAVYESENGIVDYVSWANEGATVLHPPILFVAENETLRVAVALQYNEGMETTVQSFINRIPTPQGGTHISGFQTALTKSVNAIGKPKTNLTGDEVQKGLVAIVSVTLYDSSLMHFSGQNKQNFTGAVTGIVNSLCYAQLTEIFTKQSKTIKAIVTQAQKARAAYDASAAARKLSTVKSALDAPDTDLVKLRDVNKGALKEQTVLFIVEGDSAGGSAVEARDRMLHAILALRGKPINAVKATMASLVGNGKDSGNREIKTIVAAIGAGMGRDFDASKMRYGRIAILSDADVDGAHIRALLMAFFFIHMRPLVEQGLLYIAEAPLYLVSNGKDSVYCYTDTERKQAQKAIPKGKVQRFKGLGEMGAEQLSETIFSPDGRLIQVTLEDALSATHVVNVTMGGGGDVGLQTWMNQRWENKP